ncbi:MAG TPA: hypothetical protein VGH90_08065, partial [Chthoniobacteraceae bacterium]
VDLPNLRAHLRLWAGDHVTMQRLVSWLGKPDMNPLPKEGLDQEETHATLSAFRDLWDFTEDRTELRAELAGRITQVAKSIAVRPDDATRQILTDLAEKLKRDSISAEAHDAVSQALGK